MRVIAKKLGDQLFSYFSTCRPRSETLKLRTVRMNVRRWSAKSHSRKAYHGIHAHPARVQLRLNTLRQKLLVFAHGGEHKGKHPLGLVYAVRLPAPREMKPKTRLQRFQQQFHGRQRQNTFGPCG